MVGDSLSPPDILVGARDEFSSTFIPPGCTIAQGGRLAGAAYIVDGSDGSMPYKLIGERSKDHVGFDVAARDHDGDGEMDLVTAGLAWTNPADEPVECNNKAEVGRLYIYPAAALP